MLPAKNSFQKGLVISEILMLNIEFWCSLLNYLLKQTISLQFFKGSLPQDLPSPLLNTFNQIILSIVAVCLRFYATASRAEVHSEPCQASKMKRVFFQKKLTVFSR